MQLLAFLVPELLKKILMVFLTFGFLTGLQLYEENEVTFPAFIPTKHQNTTNSTLLDAPCSLSFAINADTWFISTNQELGT